MQVRVEEKKVKSEGATKASQRMKPQENEVSQEVAA